MTLIIAVPKGRILEEVLPLFAKINLQIEDSFFDDKVRKLIFDTNDSNLKIVKVKSGDVATFVAMGAAQIGICGLDVIMEFNYHDIYTPLNLNIGKCRLSLAGFKEASFFDGNNIKIATKYPNITNKFFKKKNIRVSSIKLNGSMEIAPILHMCDNIVDLVQTGKTLLENNLVEKEVILNVSSYLVMNRSFFKTDGYNARRYIDTFSS